MPAKPFSVCLASMQSASKRLQGSMRDGIASADASPLVAYREHAQLLRAMLPHVTRMQALLDSLEAATAKRRPFLPADGGHSPC